MTVTVALVALLRSGMTIRGDFFLIQVYIGSSDCDIKAVNDASIKSAEAKPLLS